ncbi:MAG: alpha/beta hydrolase [Rhodothermales bacterium]|nr:alpha/beta hydrolase [Rhodothermales bacterium]
MLKTTLVTLFGVVILYGAFAAVVYVIQERLLYHPSEQLATTPGHHELLFEPVTLTTSDRENLVAWWLPAQRSRGVLLFLHGNAGNMGDRMESLKVFNQLRLSVLIFDYRGFGRSSGVPSEHGLYEDAETAWRHLTGAMGIDPMKIVVFGRSLGAGVATHLAQRHSTRAVILESGFTSVHDLTADHYPFLPVRWLMNDKFDSMSRIHDLQTGALLVIHSTDDEIVPYRHGQELYEAARGNKELLTISGRHNNGFMVTGDAYVDAIDAFLDKHLSR